jgi:hypothetical protein
LIFSACVNCANAASALVYAAAQSPSPAAAKTVAAEASIESIGVFIFKNEDNNKMRNLLAQKSMREGFIQECLFHITSASVVGLIWTREHIVPNSEPREVQGLAIVIYASASEYWLWVSKIRSGIIQAN